MRPRISMNSTVGLQISTMTEIFTAFFACEVFQSFMNVNMLIKMGFLSETFEAILTHPWFLTCVCQHVSCNISLRSK